MHLSSKQIFILLFPLLVSLLLYYFNSDIATNIKIFFPSYEEYTNKTLDKKADIYLKIESKNELYQTITQKIKDRNLNRKWIADSVLYENFKVDSQREENPRVETHKRIEKHYEWRLEAVFNNKEVAIINGKVVRVSSKIDGATVLSITSNSVLLEYEKGKKWVYLFQ